MLNTIGKTLERLILHRLNVFLDNHLQGRSEHQFEFKAGRSTEKAMGRVLQMADEAAASKVVLDRYLWCMVSLDVKNTFKTVPWTNIYAALRGLNAPGYLTSMIRSYLTDRRLIIKDGVTMSITCGVPQGSVL